MGKQRFFIALAVFCLSASVIAKNSNNPFEKGASVDIGRDAAWVIGNKTATRSGSDSGTFYHLFYDRKLLRLRITKSAQDSEAAAKRHDQFTVNDVLLDGKRLPVFQWCLNNQERHKRFLQQGLKVKKEVCKNQGEVGTFTMRLNVATLDMLKKGKKLTYKLKPFRSNVSVIFDISDFSGIVAKLNTAPPPAIAKSQPKPSGVATAAVAKKCKASPPTGYSEVKAVEYNCADSAAKKKATASVGTAVSKERERKKKVAAEREEKRLAQEKANATKLANQKVAEEKLASEQAALAASAAQQQAISSDIAGKMIAMCQKKWDKGEHRCYCEKYVSHAPKAIQESSTCSGS